MEELRAEIQELKTRIDLLERPISLSDEFKNLLQSNGFILANSVVQLIMVGASTHPFQIAQVKTLDREYVISLSSSFWQFQVVIGTDYIQMANDFSPGDLLFFYSTEDDLPAPLDSVNNPYAVLDSDGLKFRIEDPSNPGNAITFTDAGKGNHYFTTE